MTTVLLWDIDGTLLTTGRAGIFAWEEAARTVCGTAIELGAMPTAGLTDAQIAALIVERCGTVPEQLIVTEMLDVYGAALPSSLHRRTGCVLPGVAEVLADLHGREDVLSLLLTGNIAIGARAKLAHYGLDRWLNGGAFCEGLGPRAEIARRAVELAAERLGQSISLDRTFVIGDTPHDVMCADAVGIRTIAVASGAYSSDELAAAGAWHVTEELPEPGSFRQLIDLM